MIGSSLSIALKQRAGTSMNEKRVEVGVAGKGICRKIMDNCLDVCNAMTSRFVKPIMARRLEKTKARNGYESV